MLKIISGITNCVSAVNGVFELSGNLKKENCAKLGYELIYTGGTMWTKLGCYNETNEISLYKPEENNFLSYPMGDNKHIQVKAEGFHEPYHLLIKNEGNETINNILIKIDFENIVIVEKESYNDYNWVYENNDGYLGAYRSMKLNIDKLLINDQLIIPFNIRSNDLYVNNSTGGISVNISADKCDKISKKYVVDICGLNE